MKNPIILISGGTGVGTSTYSLELAKALGINNITSTDMIRESIRSIFESEVIPFLNQSTYSIGCL